MSRILREMHETARDLYEGGLIDQVTMREFDLLCLPPVKRYRAADVRRIRRRAKVSQAIFAKCLNTGKTTVQQWEQGVKQPSGLASKLLQLVEHKGLNALIPERREDAAGHAAAPSLRVLVPRK